MKFADSHPSSVTPSFYQQYLFDLQVMIYQIGTTSTPLLLTLGIPLRGLSFCYWTRLSCSRSHILLWML